METIGARLVTQAASKTNDLAGDGTNTLVVLAQGLITEGVKVRYVLILCSYFKIEYSFLYLYCIVFHILCFVQVVAAGANPVQIGRGVENTAKALVSELKLMSEEVSSV